MAEPSEAQITAVGRALARRRGFRQVLDEITFLDERADPPEDEEWTPEQREVLTALAKAVLDA